MPRGNGLARRALRAVATEAGVGTERRRLSWHVKVNAALVFTKLLLEALVTSGAFLVWSLLAAGLPVAACICIAWRLDRREPEPPGVLARVFLVGAVPVVAMAVLVHSLAAAPLGRRSAAVSSGR